MLGVGDSIPDDILKEDLEDTPGLLIDEARDTLDTNAKVAGVLEFSDGLANDKQNSIAVYLKQGSTTTNTVVT